MAQVTRRTFATSAIWKMMDTISTKGVSIIISIILARLLLPENYGLVALTDVFVNFSYILVQSGLGTSLIRKKEVDDLDYSNALYFSLAVAAICYLIFFIGAPYIAGFYNQPDLMPVLRVQMLSLFLCAWGTVRNAMIVRQFKFRALCVVNCIATVVGGICGVCLAFAGFGVWALVLYTLIRDLIGNTLICFVVKWKMQWRLSMRRLKELVSFSAWVLLASLVDFGGNHIYNIVFGKRYTMEDLGYYSKGNQLPELLCLHTYGALSSVMLPAMAEKQTDSVQLKRLTRKIVSVSSYVIFPMMGGLAVVGRRVIPFLFTDKWLPCVPILWAACICYGVNPFRSINMSLIYALGDSKKGLFVEIIRLFLLACCVTLGVTVLRFTIYDIAFASGGVAIGVVLLTQFYARRLIDYHYHEWLYDICPAAVVTAVMSVVTYAVGVLGDALPGIMFVQIFVGVAVYLFVSFLFRLQSFIEICEIASMIVFKKRQIHE